MKKIFSGIIVFLLTLVLLPLAHVHDEECGYDYETKSGCIFEDMEYEDSGVSTFQHKYPPD